METNVPISKDTVETWPESLQKVWQVFGHDEPNRVLYYGHLFRDVARLYLGAAAEFANIDEILHKCSIAMAPQMSRAAKIARLSHIAMAKDTDEKHYELLELTARQAKTIDAQNAAAIKETNETNKILCEIDAILNGSDTTKGVFGRAAKIKELCRVADSELRNTNQAELNAIDQALHGNLTGLIMDSTTVTIRSRAIISLRKIASQTETDAKTIIGLNQRLTRAVADKTEATQELSRAQAQLETQANTIGKYQERLDAQAKTIEEMTRQATMAKPADEPTQPVTSAIQPFDFNTCKNRDGGEAMFKKWPVEKVVGPADSNGNYACLYVVCPTENPNGKPEWHSVNKIHLYNLPAPVQPRLGLLSVYVVIKFDRGEPFPHYLNCYMEHSSQFNRPLNIGETRYVIDLDKKWVTLYGQGTVNDFSIYDQTLTPDFFKALDLLDLARACKPAA